MKRSRSQPGVCGSVVCWHGIVRTACNICDPVGYKISRIRACVAGGLRRVGTVKSKKTLQYLGLPSFDSFIQHMQVKMDRYNSENPGKLHMTFDNIHIDHIKPAKAFGDEINHYTNLQPLLPDMNVFKKAQWSQQDEVFWRENIRHSTNYNDIYMGEGAARGVIPREEMIEVRAEIIKESEETIKEFGLWTANKDTKFASTFDTKLANIRDIPYAPLNQGLAETLLSAKSALNVVIQTFTETEDKWAGRRVQNIFLRKCAEDSNKNILLGMYTAVKLQKMILHSQTVEFDERKYLPVCNMVLLLHELMVAFNTGLPEAVHLKVLNITLSQCDYDEDEEIAIDNNAWTLYQRYSKMVRTRPTTRRALMGVIFSLSQKIFGKYFTYKNETCRRSMDKTKIKCYNYKSNDTIVRVHVKLADWSKRNLDDFDRDIVAKYKLAECQKRDREGPTLNDFFAISNDERFIPDPPLAPVILKPMVLSYVAPQNPKKRTKRLHLVDTVPSKHQVNVPLSCDAQDTTSQQELRRVQLKRQKEWHSDLNSEKHDDKQEQKRQRRDGES